MEEINHQTLLKKAAEYQVDYSVWFYNNPIPCEQFRIWVKSTYEKTFSPTSMCATTKKTPPNSHALKI